MTVNQFLKYEVSLLLAKYGRTGVLNALAEKLNCSETELEELLAEINKHKTAPHVSRTASTSEQLDEVIAKHPEKATQLRTLNTRFQNRTFLPELRDVRRFFEQHSQSHGYLKSRPASFSRLFGLLAGLDSAELDALCKIEPDERSSLGMIADEILRRDR